MRRSRDSGRSDTPKRVAIAYSSPLLGDDLADLLRGPAALLNVSDGRTFDPTDFGRGTNKRYRAPVLLSGARAPLVHRGSALRYSPPHRIGFAAPAAVVTCVRRKVRRQVLHALRRTGKGSGHGKKRRTPLSNIHCR